MDFSADFVRGVAAMVSRIREIYRQANGTPDPKPPLACPCCGQETTNYNCAWGYNNHVAFKCPSCGFGFIQ